MTHKTKVFQLKIHLFKKENKINLNKIRSKNLNMTLCGKIINFSGLNSRYHFDKAACVCHVTVVQLHPSQFVTFWIIVQVLDSTSVKCAGPSYDSVHLVSLIQQKLCQIRPILSAKFINE